MDAAHTIVLPQRPAPAPRRTVPWVAAVVPVAAGVAMWAVSGSLLALCFAGLGPLMMLASLVDGGRTARAERRRTARESAAEWERAEGELLALRRARRAELWRRHPALAEHLREPALHGGRPGPSTPLVLGAGDVALECTVSGGEGERAADFRRRAERLPGAPVTVPLGAGICLRGPLPVTAAVARALVVQLCACFAPGALALTGPGLEAIGLSGLAHARHPATGSWRLAVVIGVEPVPGADAVLHLCTESETPLGLSTVIDSTDPSRGLVRTARGEQAVRLQALSLGQAGALAGAWGAIGTGGPPDALALAELGPAGGGAGLAAAIGRGAGGDLALDLVADGPHAIVTGMTGAGKSELLVTWVTALAAAYGPERLAFVLADFKGGTAFDPLAVLPQVGAVISDLDAARAQRGVESLRAELRRRERVLAEAGARDINQLAGSLPRLVIVVDEFAALLHEHAELAGVFTDIAARGRALGMHLILGTQRATGVVREALAANCPLRLSLRVTEAADSKAVIGTDAAAALPGDSGGRGLALARRPSDAEPMLVRIARTTADDVAGVAAAWEGHKPAACPWLPPLPARLEFAGIARGGSVAAESGEASRGEPEALARVTGGELLLGLLDEPTQQRQRPAVLRVGAERGLLVLGGPGSGKSGVLVLLAAQHGDARVIPADAEGAWDAVTALASHPQPGLVLCDDLDVLLTQYPPDHAHEFAQRWEQLLRGAARAGATVVVTASRLSAAVARPTELLPRRALLSFPSRAEHLAAGGDVQGFTPGLPPGRGVLDGAPVQFALAPSAEPPSTIGWPAVSRSPQWPASAPRPFSPPLDSTASPEPAFLRPEEWVPQGTTAIVAPHPDRLAAALRSRHPDHAIVSLVDLEGEPDADAIVIGDGEGWQRAWALWQRLRREVEVLVLAECTTELRTLAGVRELPPYAQPHAGRAWLLRPGDAPLRVTGLDL